MCIIYILLYKPAKGLIQRVRLDGVHGQLLTMSFNFSSKLLPDFISKGQIFRFSWTCPRPLTRTSFAYCRVCSTGQVNTMSHLHFKFNMVMLMFYERPSLKLKPAIIEYPCFISGSVPAAKVQKLNLLDMLENFLFVHAFGYMCY